PRLSLRLSVAAVALLGLYPPLLDHVSLLYTEVLCFFLVCGWTYHALAAERAAWHGVLAGVYLGVLCLTKVIFAYVLVVFGVLALALWAYEKRGVWRGFALQTGLAFLLCAPYLAYTHDLTGRWFYWSSAGPNSFYWLTSPYEEEVGDWYHDGWVDKNPLLR